MSEGKRRILLVDDEPDIAKVLQRRLELSGFDVVTAVDGASALVQAGAVRPDLIILDVMLPKLNGYEVCAQLKQDPTLKRIPIVMFTAKGQRQEHLAGLLLGANAYVSKTVGYEVLLEQIRALVRQASSPDSSRPA